MEYRKLNLKDGPEEDLHTFMRLFKLGLEHKRPGAAAFVNIDLLSKLMAAGTITANALFNDGQAIGIQVFEAAQFWFDTSVKYANLRLQYVQGDISAAEFVAFTLWGAEQAKVTGAQVISTIEEPDQLYPLLPHCDFKDFGIVKQL